MEHLRSRSHQKSQGVLASIIRAALASLAITNRAEKFGEPVEIKLRQSRGAARRMDKSISIPFANFPRRLLLEGKSF